MHSMGPANKGEACILHGVKLVKLYLLSRIYMRCSNVNAQFVVQLTGQQTPTVSSKNLVIRIKPTLD